MKKPADTILFKMTIEMGNGMCAPAGLCEGARR